jgi:MFS family permease
VVGHSVPRWLVRLLVCVALTQSALNLSRPITSYRALALGADARAIGLITAAYAILPVLAALPLGRLADRWRPAPLVSAGAVLLAAGSALLGVAPSPAALGVWSAVLGLGHLSFMVGAQTLIAQRSPVEQHDRSYGLFTAVTSFGQLVGPALGGLVLGVSTGPFLTSTTWGFLVAAGLAVAAVPISVGLLAGRRDRPVRSEPVSQPSAWGILRLPSVSAAMFASLTLLAAVDIVTAYLPVIGERNGIGPGVIGALLSLRAAASIVSRLLVAPMVRAWGRIPLIVASAAGSAVAAVFLPIFADPVVLAVLLVVAGFFLGIGQPLTMTLVVQAVPAQVRGAALAMRLTGNRAGQVAVPAAAGVVAGAAGVAAAFWLTAALLGAAAWGVARR